MMSHLQKTMLLQQAHKIKMCKTLHNTRCKPEKATQVIR